MAGCTANLILKDDKNIYIAISEDSRSVLRNKNVNI